MKKFFTLFILSAFLFMPNIGIGGGEKSGDVTQAY